MADFTAEQQSAKTYEISEALRPFRKDARAHLRN